MDMYGHKSFAEHRCIKDQPQRQELWPSFEMSSARNKLPTILGNA